MPHMDKHLLQGPILKNSSEIAVQRLCEYSDFHSSLKSFLSTQKGNALFVVNIKALWKPALSNMYQKKFLLFGMSTE